jgi:hypothetical protein
MEAAAAECGLPIRYRTARINTYVYRARVPDGKAVELSKPPALDFDLESASPAALRDHLDEAFAQLRMGLLSQCVAELPSRLRDELGQAVEGGEGAAKLLAIVSELGSRYARAGMLERADDVVHLTLDELRSLPRGRDVRPLVAARRAELEFFRTVAPPPVIPPAEE